MASRRLIIALSLLAVIVAASCGGSDDAAPSGGQQKFDDATLATVDNMMHLSEYVGVERGFFAKNGLNVQLDILADGADVNKALESGKAQFGSASTTSVPAARAAGLEQKLVAPVMNDATSATYTGPLGIVGRKDRGIKPGDISSLIGKRVAVHEASTNHEYLLLLLAQNNIDPNEVEIVPIETPDQPVTLSQGDVDAASGWEPFVSQMVNELGDNGVIVSRSDPVLGYTIGVGAPDSVIAEERDIMKKFSMGVAEASYWIRQNPEEAAEVATNFISGLASEHAIAAMDHLSFDPRISTCTLQAWDAAAKGLEKKGDIDSAPSSKAMIDTSIMAEVERENPQWFSDLPPIPKKCR
jgi:ABC-type nitrate/sulfonate/bicarbonate transport system substrate-binding protein